jgi:hypothetical protein
METHFSQWILRADTGALGKLVLESIARRHPEIFDVIGGGDGRGSEVELDPQPLPPRIAFMISIARTVIQTTIKYVIKGKKGYQKYL